MRELTIYTDGASKGNPGPAGIGVVVADAENNVLSELGEYIGHTTNNVAEYTALVRGLQEAVRLRADVVTVVTDSELMARQVNGTYRVKSALLYPLYRNALTILECFRSHKIVHVPREMNRRADQLANEGVNKASDSRKVELSGGGEARAVGPQGQLEL